MSRKINPDLEDFAIPKEDFIEFLDTLPTSSRAHLDALIRVLAQCYGEEPPLQGLILLNAPPSEMFSVMALNCTDMDAAQLLNDAVEALGYINTKDAPPKEMFN